MALPGFAITNLFTRLRRALNNRDTFEDVLPFDWEWEERRDTYARWDKLAANTIYRKQSESGMREIILKDVLNRKNTDETPLFGLFNPIREIVEVYQNVFRGSWGRDIWINDPQGEEIDHTAPLYDIIERIWNWSSFDCRKQLMQDWGALYGSVGLRIEARPAGDGADPKTAARVRIHVEHPGRIIDFDEDADGNCTSVLLRYGELTGPLGEKRRTIAVEEYLTKKEFRITRDGQTTTLPNELGVCPYVILKHRDVGSEWGVPAFWGSEDIVHVINWRITRQDSSVDRHQFPKWMASGSGARPSQFDLGETTVAYVQTEAGDPAPTLVPIVPQIDQASSQAFWQELVAGLQVKQPELVLSNLKVLSGQSGETIAQLLKPVADRIERAKANYESALKRAIQIGTSWAIMLGITDLGTGTGTRQAADAAYDQGKEDFTWNARAPLPESPFDAMNREEADTFGRGKGLEQAKSAEGLVSEAERLRIAGYTTEEIAQIQREKAKDDAIATEQDALDNPGGAFQPPQKASNAPANPFPQPPQPTKKPESPTLRERGSLARGA